MADKKTKKDWFEEIKEIINESDSDLKEQIVEFINKQIEALDAKAERAKERAEKQKIKGDELREIVRGVLTNDFQTIDEITAQIEVDGITKAKVTARLTQLVNAEIATKDIVKTTDDRKVMAYKLV